MTHVTAEVGTYYEVSNQFQLAWGSHTVVYLAGGGFVITRTANSATTAQVYDSSGNAVGSAFAVSGSYIVPLANGNFVTVRNPFTGDTYWSEVYGQVYTPAGVKVGSEFLMNSVRTMNQWLTDVAPLEGGGFVATWSDQSTGALKAQIFSSTGAKVGGEFAIASGFNINSTTPTSIAGLEDGSFVVTWTVSSTGQGVDVYAQRYSATGAAIGSRFLAHSPSAEHQTGPEIASLAGGGYVIAWVDGAPDNRQIKAQIFDAAGSKVGGAFQLSTGSFGTESAVEIVALASGGFVAAWQDGAQVKAQIFSSTGDKIGAEFALNASTWVSGISLAVTTDGNIVISWYETDELGSVRTSEIEVRVLTATSSAPHDLTLSLGSLTETTPESTLVGNLLADGAINGIYSFEILSDSSGGAFALDGSGLVIADSSLLDHETAQEVLVAIRVTDQDGNSYDEELLIPIGDASVEAQYFAAPETLVNSTTAAAQSGSAIAQLPDGGSIIVWQSGSEVRAQFLDASSQPVGPELLVGTISPSSYYGFLDSVSVSVLQDGQIAVVWGEANDSYDSWDYSYVHIQLLDASGSPTRGVISSTGYSSASELPTAVVPVGDDMFAVLWNDGGARVQTYTLDGTAVGSPILLGGGTGIAATSLASGGFVATWAEYASTGPDPSGYHVSAQLFDAAGQLVGGEFIVNTTTVGMQWIPTVTALEGGGFVIAWTDSSGADGDSSGYQIRAQVYDSTGAKVGIEFRVNSTTLGDQTDAVIAALPNGGFVVAWSDRSGVGGDTQAWSIKAQFYDSAGNPVGSEFLVNEETLHSQTEPGIEVLPSGDILFTWTDSSGIGGDSSNSGIKSRTFSTTAMEPSGADSTLTMIEDSAHVFTSADFGFADPDGHQFAGVVIATLPAIGSLTLSGSAVAADDFITAADIAAGNLVFAPGAGESGTGYASFSFAVRDTGGTSGDGVDTDQTPNTLIFDVAPVNDEPAGSDASFVIDEDGLYVFTANDFGFSDTDGNAFAGVRIVTLPSAGALFLDGLAIAADTFVSAADIVAGNLTFAPQADENGSYYDSFTFQVRDDGGTDNGGVDTDPYADTFAFDVTAVNDAPVVTIAPPPVAVGGETLVNSTTFGDQLDPAIAALADGGYIVSWRSLNPDGSYGLYTQRYDASGAAVGGETLVGTQVTNASYQLAPSVAPLESGGYVVTWMSSLTADGTTHDVYAQLYDSSGVAQGAVTVVNTTTTGNQFYPAAAALADGGYVITWDAGGEIYTQRYDQSGVAQGGETLVTTTPTDATSQQWSSAAGLEDGGYVVTWMAYDQDGTAWNVYAQRYDASGAAQGVATMVNTTTSDHERDPAIAALADGGYVISWMTVNAFGTGEIYAQRFDADGVAQGGEILVNTSTGGDQWFPSVAALPDGGFIVTWKGHDSNGNGVFVQSFDANGVAQGSETLVNTTTAGHQTNPSVATLADGGFVVAWMSPNQDGSGFGVFSQQFEPTFLATEQTFTDLKGTMSVADVDAGGATLTATLSVDSGILDVSAGTSGALVSGSGTSSVTITGTLAQINDLLGANATSTVTYTADSDSPPASAQLTLSVDDGGNSGTGGAQIGSATETIVITPVDDPGVAQGDSFVTVENAVATGNVLADNGSGADTDPDSTVTVAAVNGDSAAVGQQITLTSGALLTLNSDGTFSYDPNGAFDDLPGPDSGASNTSAVDSFSYTLAGGEIAIVGVTVNGLSSGDENLEGTPGNDTLDGGAGADTMAGGDGDDSYVADDPGDVVTEASGEGTDRVLASVSYTLGANVENLTLTGSGAIDGTGNGLANTIIGNSASNTLTGGGGNDRLNGGGGADTLIGGAGHDTYVVDDIGDVVTELAAQGTDQVYAFVSHTLADNVENLFLYGTADIDGTGNGQANKLFGNDGDNVLTGGAGRDRLNGGLGTDTLIGGADHDTYFIDDALDTIVELAGEGIDQVYASVDHALAANVENLILTGSAGISGTGNNLANKLYGNDGGNFLYGEGGKDRLDGGAGADTMAGGTGNDIYIVDNAGDVVTELSGEGADHVYSSVNHALAANVEHLTLTGAATEGTGNAMSNSITGNELANSLRGEAGADVIKGGGGDDQIHGGYGNDRLTGGDGADSFVFDTILNLNQNVDQILDFTAADDSILLDRAVFTAIADGQLAASAFHLGTEAASADHRIIYDSASGSLYYDADGDGAGAAILFARMTPGTALTNDDLFGI